MVRQLAFTHTENVAFNYPDKQSSDIASSQSLTIYQTSHTISSPRFRSEQGKVFGKQSSYQGIETQRIQSLKQVFPIPLKKASGEEYTQVLRFPVNPIDIERKVTILSSPTIPVTSPIHSLQSLKRGWDGYWADPLSQEILFRANKLWRQIEQITFNQADLPTVQPAANGSVAFTWSHKHPKKELEIWLYDQSDYYAEWMLSANDEDEENTAQSQVDLLKVIKRYQEL